MYKKFNSMIKAYKQIYNQEGGPIIDYWECAKWEKVVPHWQKRMTKLGDQIITKLNQTNTDLISQSFKGDMS